MYNKYNHILTKKFLKKEYFVCNKSILRISKETNIPCSSVRGRFLKYNLKYREPKRRKYYCINCKREIHRRSKRCKKCFIKWFTGKNHSCFKDGKTLGIHYCIRGCRKKVSSKGIRCRKCALKEISLLIKKRKSLKGKNNGRYIDGRSSKKYYCIFINCNKQITKGSKSGYCHSHEAKNRLKNITGKNHPNWKSDRAITRQTYYCIKDCGEKVQWHSAVYGSGKCRKCGIKERRDFKGKNNPGWKGGKLSLKGLIRRSNKYKSWRNYIFQKDNYTCQECFQIGGKLHSHHIKPFAIILQEFLQTYSQFSPIKDKETLVGLSESYESFWEITNGKTLCINCHKLTDNYLKKKKY